MNGAVKDQPSKMPRAASASIPLTMHPSPMQPATSGWRSLRAEPALRSEFDGLYADYAAALDERRYEDWLKFFTEDCRYKVQSRENHSRGLPLATLAFESRGMLQDRIYGVVETLFHQPYYQRHVLGPLRILEVNDHGDPMEQRVRIECNYAVFRVKLNTLPEVFNVGRYLDTWRFSEAGWKLENKLVVFDSDLIANSMIYPI